MPPPSSGGIALLEMLNILEPFNLSKLESGSPEKYHLMIEAIQGNRTAPTEIERKL